MGQNKPLPRRFTSPRSQASVLGQRANRGEYTVWVKAQSCDGAHTAQPLGSCMRWLPEDSPPTEDAEPLCACSEDCGLCACGWDQFCIASLKAEYCLSDVPRLT